MTPAAVRYRKLPGRKRGIFHAASLWVHEDHLLSVKSDRFHEYYKRFFFRDIQALVVTREPRFVVTTPAVGVFVLLVIGALFVRSQFPEISLYAWTVLLAAIGGWVWVSAARSCSLRLYTAVSREDLPSVYRIWTARRLLSRVQPLIETTQGRVQEGWAEAMAVTAAPDSGLQSLEGRSRRAAGRARTLLSDLFLVGLFMDASLTLWETVYRGNVPTYISGTLALLEVLLAVGVIMQRQRRILRPAMQKIAIGALLLMGGELYTQSMITTILNTRAGKTDPTVLVPEHRQTSVRLIYIVGCYALASAGLVVSFGWRGKEE